ncbi:hypothetical protein ACFPRL_27215 [Pseudoclavibacter helvolus]
MPLLRREVPRPVAPRRPRRGVRAVNEDEDEPTIGRSSDLN